MPELDDAALERRLRGVLKEHLGALPLDLTVETLDRRREAKGAGRRSSRGRGLTLLAAAALLIVGGALAAGSGLLRLPSVVPPLPAPSVVAIATASPDATFPSPSESAAPSTSPILVAGPGGIWIPTGSMTTPLDGNAVRLLDGRVLVVGGSGAQVYDPATGTWTATGKMIGDVEDATFTVLRDGRVLAVGGDGAEVYDPASRTWTATAKRVKGPDLLCYGVGEACEGFGRHHATLLDDGKVLVAGPGGAQLYDAVSGTWTATGKMNLPRFYGDAATLLSDGKVLVAGGRVEGELIAGDLPVTDTAEVYDPATGSWTEIANMKAPHVFGPAGLAMATRLRDGKVLVVAPTGQPVVEAPERPRGSEVYDPATGTWTARTMPTEFEPKALVTDGVPRALLSDETVLIAPIGNNADGCTAAALFDPQTGSLTTTSSMLRCHDGSSFTLLLDGTVLVAGGRACDQGGVTPGSGGSTCVSTGAAELYVPAGVSLPPFSFPSPPPPVFPSPTPVPPLLPPADGPTPPNARSWSVTVENRSSEPATMFVAEGEEGAFRLVGSATPNVVPAGTTMKVTFRFPAKGTPDDGWISVNPRLGEGADVGSVGADNIGMPGKIRITAECGGCWVGPAQ